MSIHSANFRIKARIMPKSTVVTGFYPASTTRRQAEARRHHDPLRRGLACCRIHALRPAAGEKELDVTLEAGDLGLHRAFECGCRWDTDGEDVAEGGSRRRDNQRVEADAGAVR